MIKNSFKISGHNEGNYKIHCSNKKELLDNIKMGYDTLVVGSFKSGKTALLNDLELGNYYVSKVSFPNTLNIPLCKFFCNVTRISPFDSDTGLIGDFLCSSFNKKWVILFDDFDRVLGQKDIQQFLLELKRLKERPISTIQSIVIFGNYDLLKIPSLLDRFVTLSPVSFESTIFLSNTDRERTLSLFEYWSQEYKVSIGKELLNELWLLCNGNLHLINIIGIVLTRLNQVEEYTTLNEIDIIKERVLELIKQQQIYRFLKSYINKSSTLPEVLNNIVFHGSSIDSISYNDLIVLSNFGLFIFKDSKYQLSSQILIEYLFNKSSLVL